MLHFRFRPFASLRGRLVAWNILALAILLGALGRILPLLVRTEMLRSVDMDLANRARQAREHPPPWMAPPPPMEPNDHPPEQGDPDDRRPPREPRAGEPPHDDFPRRPHPHPRPRDEGQAQEGRGTMRPSYIDAPGKNQEGRQQTLWDKTGYDQALLGSANYQTITQDSEPVRVFSMPVLFRRRVEGVIQVPYVLTEVYRAVDGLNQTLLLMTPVALIVAGFGGFWMTGRALQAVKGITLAAQRIGADALHQRLPVQGEDELGQLAGTFNEMLGRIEEGFNTKQELINRLNTLIEQQRRFTADAAHELRTPLTAIKVNAGVTLSQGATQEEYRQVMQEIDTTTTSMARLVDDLLLLARSDSQQLARNPIELPLVESLLGAIGRVRRTDRAPITLEMEDQSLVVRGVEDEITRLFTNLLENAGRHTPQEGKITVRAKREGEQALIEIADTGTGIAPEHLAHLGERFYRVDTARARNEGGSGLGLSICKSIVEAHGGSMQLKSRLSEGTTVLVRLPLVA